MCTTTQNGCLVLFEIVWYHSNNHVYKDLLSLNTVMLLFFPSFPFCRGETDQLSLRCTATFVILSIALRCWPFLYTFLPSLPFLDISSHNPPILSIYYFSFSATFLFLCLIFSVISRLSFLPCVQPISCSMNRTLLTERMREIIFNLYFACLQSCYLYYYHSCSFLHESRS